MQQIESGLNTRMDIGEAELNLFSRFPLASIELGSVWLEDAATEGDTLLEAEKALLSFNPWNFIRGEYEVERIDLVNGRIRILEDEAGDNYHFWKSNPGGGDSTFTFNLSHIQLKNVDVLYQNEKSHVLTRATAQDLELKGAFTEIGHF